MAKHHHANAHSPFFPGRSGGCLFAVCDEASDEDVKEEMSHLFDAVIGLCQLLVQSDEENLEAVYGLAYLVKVAQGLHESLRA